MKDPLEILCEVMEDAEDRRRAANKQEIRDGLLTIFVIFPLTVFVVWLLVGCTTVQMPNGARLSTPAEMKNVTMTADSFHADEISHAGIYKSLQGIGTMLGVGAFLP